MNTYSSVQCSNDLKKKCEMHWLVWVNNFLMCFLSVGCFMDSQHFQIEWQGLLRSRFKSLRLIWIFVTAIQQLLLPIWWLNVNRKFVHEWNSFYFLTFNNNKWQALLFLRQRSIHKHTHSNDNDDSHYIHHVRLYVHYFHW